MKIHLGTELVVPVHKKEINELGKFRPVSVLPNLFKMYEKLMYLQLYKYFNLILSPKQCSFKKCIAHNIV